jgi:cytoskeleton protein RodZ
MLTSATGKQNTLRFSATHDAWIQVIDGDGKRFSKLIRAGADDAIAGTPPFKLVVGEAAQVRLSYNGHVIDLQPFIGQKVARLTLE